MNPNVELIRFYAKQLKIPTFADYAEVLRHSDPSADFTELLLELMTAESKSRQEKVEGSWLPISENHGGIRL